MHALGGWLWRAFARVQCWLPGVETTEVEAHMASNRLFATIIDSRLPTGSTNFDHDGGY